jgi:sugar-specific transcriptional regulator TrmB
MDTKILEEIGLTKNEIKIYLALLKLGATTSGKIILESQLHRSRVYDALERLIDKGLVSYVIKANRKWFQAAPPNTILGFLDEKRKNVTEILPALQLLKTQTKSEQLAGVYEGIRGYKSAREKLIKELKKGDKLLVLGAPAKANEKLEGWFIYFHTRREKAGIGMKILYNENARKYGLIRKKWKLTKVKYMKNNAITPAWIEIFKESVAIIIISDNPLTFVIKNKEAVDSFKTYFNMMWKTAIN